MTFTRTFAHATAGATAIAVLAGGMALGALTVAPASALESEGLYYSSKQPYVAPDADTIDAYSAAPQGYEPIYTESMARHGSRGLSSYKYDALLKLMARTAADPSVNGFQSEAVKTEFLKNLDAITAANVGNGYGMLTGQGADQHRSIGERAFQRNRTLFERAAAEGGVIAYQSSGEARATESGENFEKGFNAASDNLLAGNVAKPTNPADGGAGKDFQKRPDTLYFHKVENPDGSKKQPGTPAYDIAKRYEDFIDGDATIANAEDRIANDDSVVAAANDLLTQIFTPEFLSKVGDEYTWYNTADGSKGGAANCAPNADPATDPDACGEASKKIKTTVDAAMDLYNLYIIAADMKNENTGSRTFDFDQYFQGKQAADAKTFAWVLDSEDFYEKGPSYAGQSQTYSIAQPLLDDFFATIDARVNGGDTAATFRFAHAETMMPFAALLGLPGSTQQAPAVEAPQTLNDVYTYDNNAWRGESVTPMAANVQWDVVARPGLDPRTGGTYTPLVRMLYNETETPFRAECTPIANGSHWYKLTELKSCLSAGHRTLGDDARLAADVDANPGDGGHATNPPTNGTHDDVNGAGNASNTASTKPLARTGSVLLPFATVATLLAAAGISVMLFRVRR